MQTVDGYEVRNDGGEVTYDPIVNGDYLADVLDAE